MSETTPENEENQSEQARDPETGQFVSEEDVKESEAPEEGENQDDGEEVEKES